LVGDRRRIEDHDVGVGARGEPPLAAASRARGLQATGSAHAVLGPWWAEGPRPLPPQCAAGIPRRGRLAIAVEDNQVHVGGHAVTSPEGSGSSNIVTRNPGGAVCLPG